MTYRTALFASAFHPHVGGVEELVKQLGHEQVRRGGSPLVVTNRYPKDLPEQETVEGLVVRRFPFRVPEPTLRQLGGWALFAASTQRAVSGVVRLHAADVVHVQCVSSNGRYALHAADETGAALVVSLQGELSMDATAVYARSRQLRRSWQRLIEAADVVTGCSRYVLDEAERVYGRPLGERGRVVYNGIRLEDFATPAAAPEQPFVLGIGRMVPQKGFDLLLHAFALARPRDHRLVLAGDGPDRTALESLAAELGIAPKVDFLGRVEHARAVELFQQAAVFVLPSRHEPQGIVVLEAMAAGTPVIAASVGGVPEIVRDEHNGLLFAGGDAEQLSARLSAVLSSEQLGRHLSHEAAMTARGLSWERIAAEYDECYAAAVEGRSGGSPRTSR